MYMGFHMVPKGLWESCNDTVTRQDQCGDRGERGMRKL